MIEDQPQQQRITFLECLAHEGEALSRICLTSGCENSCLICSNCERTNHTGHDVVPLKGFLQKLQQQKHCIEVESLTQEFVERLKENQKRWNQLLREVQSKIKRLLRDLQSKAKLHFERVQELMKMEFSSQVRMNLITRRFDYNTNRKHLELVGELGEMVRHHKAHADSIAKLGCQIQVRVNKAEDDRELLLKDLMKTAEESFGRVIHNLTDQQGSQAEMLKWSEMERHSDFEIHGKVIERKEIWNSGFICAYADRLVNLSPPFTHRWIWKIRKMPGMIDLGICLESVVKGVGYIYNSWEQTGHGVYAIGSMGASHHHTDKLKNLSRLSFEFTVGDQIQVDYNLVDGILSFSKNNRESLYQMSIPAAPVNDNYRPCVFLWKVGDSVEIIDLGKRGGK